MNRFCAFVVRNDVAVLLLALAPLLAMLLIVALAGCSLRGRNLPARTAVSVAYDPALEAQCAKMNRRVMGFTATAIGLGVAGAATGLPSLFTSNTSRYATAGTSIGVAIASAVFTYLSNAEAAAYAKTCTAGTTGAP